MDLLTRFQQQIKEQNFFSPAEHLLLAVSGGVDSVVMAHLCKASGYRCTIVHCNFRLRGTESDEDEKFVSALALSLGMPFLSKAFDTEVFATGNKMGIQEAARQLRYEWFRQLLSEKDTAVSYDRLLTAHQADDNVETLLMNFFKGTGIHGLQGIRARSGPIVRPLLFAFREDIRNYAERNGLAFREDSSNLSSVYTRNYFRNEWIPSVEKVFPTVRQNLNNNLGRFADIACIYEDWIGKVKKKLLEYHDGEVHISIGRLARTPAIQTVIYEIISDFGFSPAQAGEVMALMRSGSGKQVFSASHRILNDRGRLIIALRGVADAAHFLIGPEEGKLEFGKHKMMLERLPAPAVLSADKSTAQLDARHIHYPLLLRRWRTGDYFYPLGMRKKKKLSRFLIDEKISLLDKEDIWVLESGGKILWVVGHRIDDRFRITEKTGDVLRLTYQ